MASQGPYYPASAVDDGVGPNAWSSAMSATSDDGTPATCLMVGSTIGNRILCSNFGFTVPAGSTIDGVLLEVERRQTGASGLIRDNEVYLRKPDSTLSSDKADTATNWPTSYTVKNYGGSSDLWGLTLSAAEVNSTTFRAELSPQNTAALDSGTAEVDFVRVTVYYTEAFTADKFPWPQAQQRQSRVVRVVPY